VVDDERELVAMFARWLEALGCSHVKTASDGECALELVRKSDFDLLISDIRMPGIDGVTLVRKIGELGKVIPSIIFVSGFGTVDKREMYGLGVEAFLSKPLHLEELKAVVEKALADRGALWSRPMEPAPRQSMVVKITEPLETKSKKGLRLGRGGFCAPYSGTLSVGRVAFRCLLEQEQGVVSGHGWVRWRSKDESIAGIEFSYLDDTCRAWVQAKIAELKPQSFIPE